MQLSLFCPRKNFFSYFHNLSWAIRKAQFSFCKMDKTNNTAFEKNECLFVCVLGREPNILNQRISLPNAPTRFFFFLFFFFLVEFYRYYAQVSWMGDKRIEWRISEFLVLIPLWWLNDSVWSHQLYLAAPYANRASVRYYATTAS